MFRRACAVLIGVLAVAALAAGCGGGDSTDSPTKEEFVKEAEAYCKDLYKEVQDQLRAAAKLQQGTSAQAQEELLVKDIIVPTLRKQADEFAAFGVPEGDEDQVDEIVVTLEGVAKQAEENPIGTLAKADPFREIDQQMEAYGLDACRH